MFSIKLQGHMMRHFLAIHKLKCVLGHVPHIKHVDFGTAGNKIREISDIGKASYTGSKLEIYGSVFSMISGIVYMGGITQGLYEFVVEGKMPISVGDCYEEVSRLGENIEDYSGKVNVLVKFLVVSNEEVLNREVKKKEVYRGTFVKYLGFDPMSVPSARSSSKWFDFTKSAGMTEVLKQRVVERDCRT